MSQESQDKDLVEVPARKSVESSLSEEGRLAVLKQLEVPTIKVTYWSLYRYASKKENAILSLSCLAAVVAGAIFPLMTVCLSGFSAGTSL